LIFDFFDSVLIQKEEKETQNPKNQIIV